MVDNETLKKNIINCAMIALIKIKAIIAMETYNITYSEAISMVIGIEYDINQWKSNTSLKYVLSYPKHWWRKLLKIY